MPALAGGPKTVLAIPFDEPRRGMVDERSEPARRGRPGHGLGTGRSQRRHVRRDEVPALCQHNADGERERAAARGHAAEPEHRQRLDVADSEVLDGLVDEVAVWNGPLTAPEVVPAKHTRIGGPATDIATPVASMAFDEGAGGVAWSGPGRSASATRRAPVESRRSSMRSATYRSIRRPRT